MKKLLSRIEPGTATSGTSSGAGHSCIGKTWTLPRHTVVVEEIIAEGGFGVVFLAKQGAQKFALKRIIVNNEHDLAVPSREIQIMTSLGDHPNLLACLDFLITPLGGGVTEALGLMPYCRGSLLALLNTRMSTKSHLSEKEVLQILCDVVCGVARLHHCATPIIHRELKIENVLEDEGRFLLCDFGSATPKFWDANVHGATAIQEDLDKYTTLAYRSPEMVDLYSGRGPITTKADIWALGVLLFKMCFYTTPFGDSILAIQSGHLTFPSTSPFSPQLHALTQYLLTPDASTRPEIFQVAELSYALLGVPNPVTNIAGVRQPPTIENLVTAMTSAAAKAKSEEKAVSASSKSTATAAPPVLQTLETSVTPRQRPKGNIVVPAPSVGAALLPPPKSPKPDHASNNNNSQNQIPVVSNPNNQNNSNQSQTQSATTTPAPTTTNSSSSSLSTATAATISIADHGHHRRNVSDSSAFEKVASQQPSSTELQPSSSETAISSWNPFENDSFVPPVGSADTEASNGNSNNGGVGTESGVVENEENTEIEDEEVVFAKAPFDYFKYRPMGSLAAVNTDLFGAEPFSNPFLDFVNSEESQGAVPLGARINNNSGGSSNNNNPVGQSIVLPHGVTNLSFEDER